MAVHNAANPEPTDTSRYERLDGLLIERPLPTLSHARLQLRIVDLLRQFNGAAELTVLPEVSLEESERSRNEWLTPDVLVAYGQEFREKANEHAVPPVHLAVEILSPGQNFFNMRSKVEILLRWGAEYVWLVEPDSRTAMVFSARDPDKEKVVFDGLLEAGELSVMLSDVFPALD